MTRVTGDRAVDGIRHQHYISVNFIVQKTHDDNIKICI